MIYLARDLTDVFYHGTDTNLVFRDVRMAIEKCKKLYKGYDVKEGNFDHDQINRYLGFFDDLGFYYKKEVLDLETIKHLFGAYVIEAYEYNEVKRYTLCGDNYGFLKVINALYCKGFMCFNFPHV